MQETGYFLNITSGNVCLMEFALASSISYMEFLTGYGYPVKDGYQAIPDSQVPKAVMDYVHDFRITTGLIYGHK
jgi:hypothetical protein